MKFPSSLFIFLISLSSQPILRADVTVEDCLKEGIAPDETQNLAVDTSELRDWPEEVTYTSYPLDIYTQSAGSTLCNETVVQGDQYINSRVVGQNFSVPAGDGDQILEKIFIPTMPIFQAGTAGTYSVRLIDLGESPDSSGYEAGTDLLSGRRTFEVTTPPSYQERNLARIMGFTFTGQDQVRLKGGHWYSFEIVADPANTERQILIWLRSSSREVSTSALPDATLFTVATSPKSTLNDRREFMKGRQGYIGIKTSKAK